LARNEFICWVEDATQTTQEHRIRRTQEELEEGQRRPCCWPGCKHRERNGRERRARSKIVRLIVSGTPCATPLDEPKFVVMSRRTMPLRSHAQPAAAASKPRASFLGVSWMADARHRSDAKYVPRITVHVR